MRHERPQSCQRPMPVPRLLRPSRSVLPLPFGLKGPRAPKHDQLPNGKGERWSKDHKPFEEESGKAPRQPVLGHGMGITAQRLMRPQTGRSLAFHSL